MATLLESATPHTPLSWALIIQYMQHLYVHVPFCRRRCSYCDFAIAVRRTVPVEEFLRALALELDARLPRGASLATVYLGGGTPSLLGGEGVARVLELVRARASIASDAEITLEANPDDVALDHARAWRAAGVNRLSLGVQSFESRVLAWMHRTHDAAQSALAVEVAREAGIEDVSLDLIFALPEALERDWEADLERALALAPEHLSLYGLTVEDGTPLGRWRSRGEAAEAPEESYEREFLRAHERLGVAGFEHYEVSNYARPGGRARHNAGYWRRTAYVGVGPSAHSFDGVRRSWNRRDYADWSRAMRGGAGAEAGGEVPGPESIEAERIYLGLRTAEGVEASARLLEAARPFITEGWARTDGSRLSLTAPGWLRLDAIAAHLTALAGRS